MPENKTQHIRPKKRIQPNHAAKTTASASDTSNSYNDDSNDNKMVEDVRIEMDSWTGLGTDGSKESVTGDAENSTTSMATASKKESKIQQTATTSKPTSILKVPKYSTTASLASSAAATTASMTVDDDHDGDNDQKEQPYPAERKQTYKPICKEFIVERDPRKHPPKRKATPKQTTNDAPPAHSAVEGYVPLSAVMNEAAKQQQQEDQNIHDKVKYNEEWIKHQQQQFDSKAKDGTNGDNEEEEDLILNSVEDLLKFGGQQEMPSNPTKIDANTQMIEADLEFNVMSQEQYKSKFEDLKKEHLQNQQDQMEMFLGTNDVFGDGSIVGDSTTQNDDDDDDDDDDDLMELFMENPEGSDDDEMEEPEPRAFRKIWDAFSDWITHDSVQYIASLEKGQYQEYVSKGVSQVDTSDIGASRCAGLMAMIKLYLPSMLKEFQQLEQQSHDQQRIAEQRLGYLLRTFNYSREAPKLDAKIWKAMTCIFVDIALVERRQSGTPNDINSNCQETVNKTALPAAVLVVGMTNDEYTYLTQKAIQTFV